MCKAAGTIIQRTPDWARRYSSNEMIPWMRDALMFANELIAQRRIFESAIVTATDAPTLSPASPSKLSSDGAQMITNFGSILSPLGSWLRLTNQELLDRSYNLLMDLFDAFKETKMVPQDQDLKVVEDTIRRLSARLEKALKSGDAEAKKNLTTRLSLAQLGTLIRRINELRGEEDSDIEFISQAFSPRKPTKPPVTKPKPRKSSEILGSAGTSHVTSKHPPRKGLLSSTAKSKGTSVKGTSLVEKMHKEVSDSMGQQQLGDDMIQRAIQERKAVRSAISLMSISSSAGEIGSSSSESESDDETGPSGLSELSKLQRSPIKPRALDRKSTMFINRPTNGPKVKMLPHPATRATIHPAPVKHIRFIPDLTPLHRIILNWDYDHDGPEPVTVNGPLILKTVPETFSSHRHYLDVFHPLLVVESWNGLVKSKEERLERIQCTITGKMFADMWVEIDTSIEQSVSKGWMLAETDIVLMEHTGGQKVLAKVHSTRQTRQGIQSTLRYSSETPKPDLERAMGLQSTWTIARVFRYISISVFRNLTYKCNSLSTVHREYAALMGIGQYDWAEDIFQARINSPVIPSDEAVRKAMIAHHLNPPQAKAVISSLGTKGFSLIQGYVSDFPLRSTLLSNVLDHPEQERRRPYVGL
jgi:senataxin